MYDELSITDPDEGIGAAVCFAETFAQQVMVGEGLAHAALGRAVHTAIADDTSFAEILPSFVDDEFLYEFTG